jgi:hypothetical protein
MTSFVRLIACVVSVAGLAGCSTLSQVQDTLTKFDQGVHSVATAQTTFMQSVRAVDCEREFYRQAIGYATSKRGIDLRVPCTPTLIKDHEIEVRQAFLEALTLYADQLEALAAAGDQKTLSDNGQSLASSINSFAKRQGFSKAGLGIGADVEDAIAGITDMVMDQKKTVLIKDAAASQQENLTKVVGYLKSENTNLAAGVDGYLGEMRSDFATMLATVRAKNNELVFFYLIQVPGILRGADPFTQGPDPKDPTSPLAMALPDTGVAALNKCLDSLVTANRALASPKNGGTVAAVKDLITRGQSAQSIPTALAK